MESVKAAADKDGNAELVTRLRNMETQTVESQALSRIDLLLAAAATEHDTQDSGPGAATANMTVSVSVNATADGCGCSFQDAASLEAEAREFYTAADVNNDGSLSKTEMKKVFHKKDAVVRARLVTGTWKDFITELDSIRGAQGRRKVRERLYTWKNRSEVDAVSGQCRVCHKSLKSRTSTIHAGCKQKEAAAAAKAEREELVAFYVHKLSICEHGNNASSATGESADVAELSVSTAAFTTATEAKQKGAGQGTLNTEPSAIEMSSQPIAGSAAASEESGQQDLEAMVTELEHSLAVSKAENFKLITKLSSTASLTEAIESQALLTALAVEGNAEEMAAAVALLNGQLTVSEEENAELQHKLTSGAAHISLLEGQIATLIEKAKLAEAEVLQKALAAASEERKVGLSMSPTRIAALEDEVMGLSTSVIELSAA